MNTTVTGERRDQSPLLSLVDEDIRYPGCVALENISFSVQRGEKVALIGPSGAGKTSLLKRLYQLKPSLCSFIHQHHALVPQLSVFHNIYMGRLDRFSTLHNLRNLVLPSPKRCGEIEPIVAQLGLNDKLWTRVGELSGGQQQRVGIGRALYRGGEILMADEPVSSLDRVQGEEIMELLTGVGKTVVSSLHYVELSRQYFDRVIGLGNRRIMFDLPADAVTDRNLAELYG